MPVKITYAYTVVTIKDLYKNQQITFYDMCEAILINYQMKKFNGIQIIKKICYTIVYVIFGKASMFIKKVNGDYNTDLEFFLVKFMKNLKNQVIKYHILI